jgi:opacity protein-like surface antigen
MSGVRILALAAAAAMLSTAAVAADFPPPLPPALPVQPAPVVETGWYLRGAIGLANQNLDKLTQRLDSTVLTQEQVGMGFDSSPFFLVGAGYEWNSWLRFDVTGEYRAKANFHGSDNVTFFDGAGTAVLADNYSASKSEILVLANAYLDLGTWYCVTPFIGAGVGMARVQIDSFRDDGVGFFSPQHGGGAINSVAFADSNATWNFAWALHAGVAYTVTPNFKVDLAYRFVHLGDGVTGRTRAFDNSFVNGGAFTFKGLTSNDLMLGVRWLIQPEAAPAYAPPLVRKG